MKNTLLGFLLSLCACIGNGQDSGLQPTAIEDRLTFHLLDVESGLSHNVVNSIEQDSLGFIWIATIEGLNRYDGNQFTKHKKDIESPNSGLINNHVEQVKLDHLGKLLLATDDGLNFYNPKYEKFEVLDQDNEISGHAVSCIAVGPNKELIIGAVRHHWGVRFIDKDGELKSFKHEPSNVSSLSSNEISSMVMQGDSVLWVATTDRGLNKLDYATKTITRIPYGKNSGTPSSNTNALYTDSNGNVWVGSTEGLQVITTKGDTLVLKASSFPSKGLSDNDVLSFEEDNENQMWIGTRNGGLNILEMAPFLSKKSDFLVKWFLPKGDGSSVFNRTVSSIKMDKDGNMWLGTATGLNFVNPKGEPIKLIQKNIDNPNALAHNRIGAFAEQKDGKVWIGTDGGGLNLFDPKTGKFWHYAHHPDKPHSLSNNYIISLLEDKNNSVWIGTYRGGLNKMNPETGHCKHYLQGGIAQGSDVRKIFEDNTGQIWVGTNRGGLFKYIEEKDQFEYIQSLGKIDIRDIRNGGDNSLWIASFGDGIINYEPGIDKIVFYNMANIKGMPSNVIFSILPLQNGDILAGTRYGGLIRLAPDTNTILNFTESDGLSNNTVSSIVMENEKNIWLGTFKGISYYNTQTHEIENLNTLNNIQRSEFNIGAVLKSRTGYLYFGGNKGLNVFKPDALLRTHQTYPIVFENFEVFNKTVPITPDSDDVILEKSISYQDHITLTHDQSMFSINFAALKYPEAKNINYSYRLDDYHDQWVDTKSIGTANLSNIPPGDYTLKVKAKIGSGKEVYEQLLVTITPPFWKTGPAYILYLILIMSIILAIMKYYSDRVKLKNSLLFEKKQRQLEHDINEERFRFFTSFSHELKTPLTLILAPVEDLMLELRSKKHLNSIRLIQKNAKYLFQSINKLLEFRKSEVGLSELTIGKHNLTSYLEQLIQNYQPLARKRHISLTLSLPEEDLMAWFDLEKLQIIVTNLLTNAFKHCEEKGRIQISLAHDEEHFRIKVQDSGTGINLGDLSHIFEWYYQSGTSTKKKGAGIGLALSKSFAELHMGEITVESQLGHGALFTLCIPRNKSLFSNTSSNKIVAPHQEKKEMSALNTWEPSSGQLPTEKKLANIHLHEDREVILLIDDNSDILQYLEGLLEDHYDLLYAENGQEGLDKAFQYIPDLIISDIMMPKKNGIDLCATLKEQMSTTHIPIILLSAKDSQESIKTGFEEGADDYIVKPFNGQILRARIRNLLDSRKQLQKYFINQEETLQGLSKQQSKLLDREKEFLKKLELVILEHLNQGKTNVEAIAQGMGMSRTSLFRKIKAITGHNINEYVRMAKIKKAAYLIKEEKFTISQAAFEVGFSSAKYFRKLFKEQYGTLPSELQRKSEV